MNQICVIGVYVSDIEQARDFYCNQLGFEVKTQYGECILQLKNENATFIIEEIKGDYPEKPCTVIATRTDDLVKEIERLRASGIKFIHPSPRKFSEGIYAAYIDFDGNPHELLEFQ